LKNKNLDTAGTYLLNIFLLTLAFPVANEIADSLYWSTELYVYACFNIFSFGLPFYQYNQTLPNWKVRNNHFSVSDVRTANQKTQMFCRKW